MAVQEVKKNTVPVEGWVIIQGSAPAHLPRYWNGGGWSTWINDAIRYCRKDDAERSLPTVAPDIHGREHRVVECTPERTK